VSVDELGNGQAVYVVPSGAEIVDTLTSFENFVAREGGEDTIDLSSFSTGVRVDLDTNTPTPGPISQDGIVQVDGETLFTLTDFENIVGTDFDDVLLGNQDINNINGGAGNDSIHSFGGADTVDGGSGIDTLLLSATPVGTVVTLDETGSGTVTINGNDADTFSNFENISGSNAGDDVLTGNQVDNVLNGNGGDDTLTGGEGSDTFVVNQTSGNDTITDFENGVDVIDVQDFGADFDLDAAIAAAVQDGANTVITLDDATTLTLQDVMLADLDASDFVTAPSMMMAEAQTTTSSSVFQSLSVDEDSEAPVLDTDIFEFDLTGQNADETFAEVEGISFEVPDMFDIA